MEDSEGSGQPEEDADEDEDLGEEPHLPEADTLHDFHQSYLVAILVVRRQIVLIKIVKEGQN